MTNPPVITCHALFRPLRCTSTATVRQERAKARCRRLCKRLSAASNKHGFKVFFFLNRMYVSISVACDKGLLSGETRIKQLDKKQLNPGNQGTYQGVGLSEVGSRTVLRVVIGFPHRQSLSKVHLPRKAFHLFLLACELPWQGHRGEKSKDSK